MDYYNKSDLSKLTILQFSEQLKDGISINLEQLVETDEHFVFDNADVFRQGVCQIFAYALHKRFGYKVYVIRVEIGCHIFCKTLDNQYVDVRGMTHSFNEFISGLALPDIKEDTSEAYSFTYDDLNGDYYDIALAFANVLIEYDIERYKI